MSRAIRARRAILSVVRCSRSTSCTNGTRSSWHLTTGSGSNASESLYEGFQGGRFGWYPWRNVSGSALLRNVIHVPEMGESITEGTIASIDKEVGDVLEEDEVIAQIETDKVTIDVRAPSSGVLDKILVSVEDNVVVGQPIAEFTPGEVEQGAPPVEQQETKVEESTTVVSSEEPATIETTKPVEASAPEPEGMEPMTSQPEAERAESRVPMSRLRRRVAERLKEAQNTYAMLTTFNEIDMTNLMDLRAAYKDQFMEVHGVKLGFMSVFAKAASAALKEMPAVNGVIDGDEIVYRHYHDISIAVGTPRGLVVPVLRNVDKLSFAHIEKGINDLGKKARDGTLSIDDMTGGTFTISNGGVYGSLLSTPIINMPQSAVLGMHSIQKRPVVIRDEVKVRPMMYVALSYDHRLIDGREAVTFLKRIKEIVEDPRRLLLDV